MLKNKRKLGMATIIISMLLMPLTALAAEEGAEYVSGMYGTFWALLPPVIAILLAFL